MDGHANIPYFELPYLYFAMQTRRNGRAIKDIHLYLTKFSQSLSVTPLKAGEKLRRTLKCKYWIRESD